MTWVWGSLALTATPGFVRMSVPQEELPEPFEHLLQRIARRPKPQQFFGLMGKRDAGEMGSHPLSVSEGPPPGLLTHSQSAQSFFCSLSRDFQPRRRGKSPSPTHMRKARARRGREAGIRVWHASGLDPNHQGQDPTLAAWTKDPNWQSRSGHGASKG